MNNYDRINVPKFEEGKQNGYLCTMCGQYVSLSESISHKGYNLICNRCEWKIRAITGDIDILTKIHNVGKKTEEENIRGDEDDD